MKELNNIVFNSFTSETALDIGLRIINIAKRNNYIITIDISKFNHQLFHYSFDGTNPDKDLWILRKRNVVFHFHTSSFAMGEKLAKDNANLQEKYGLSNSDYVAIGGSVPIIVSGVGVVGAITVSGLTPQEDHNLVIEVIQSYLKDLEKGDE